MIQRFRSIALMLFLVVGGLVLAWLSQESTREASPPTDGARVERVVCMHPAVTELFYALGQEGRLVAVSNFCTVPAAAQEKPSIGDTLQPDLERILTLTPDLVIVSGDLPTMTTFCQERGLRIENLHMEGIEGIHRGILRLGEILQETARAEALWQGIEAELANVRRQIAQQPPVPTFFAFYRVSGSLAGMTTAGAGTYIDELITLAGGRNIFADLTEPYPQVSKETLLRRQPQVILEPRAPQDLTEARRASYREDWQVLAIPAVSEQRIAFPDQDLLLRPGPRVGQAARVLAEILHPECFRE